MKQPKSPQQRGRTPLPGLFPPKNAPLVLLRYHRSELIELIDEVQLEAQAYLDKKQVKVAHDAKLPKTFADRLIADWDTWLGQWVANKAEGRQWRTPTALEVRQAKAKNEDQQQVIARARVLLQALAPERAAWEEVTEGGHFAAQRIYRTYAQADEVAADAQDYLKAKQPAIERAMDGRSAGTRPDFFAIELKDELARWWTGQGFTPTHAPRGAYQSVLKLILRIRDNKLGKSGRARKHLRVREALRSVRKPAKRKPAKK